MRPLVNISKKYPNGTFSKKPDSSCMISMFLFKLSETPFGVSKLVINYSFEFFDSNFLQSFGTVNRISI